MRLAKYSSNSIFFSFALALSFSTLVWSSETVDKHNDKFELGKAAYLSGKINKAASYLLPVAKQGHAESQYYLGLAYSSDNWAGHNTALAYSFLLSAADQNHKSAMWQIGRMHETGTGVEKDLILATDWYRKSKDQVSSTNIKLASVSNKDPDPGWQKEIEKFKTLANTGDNEAQFHLGSIYDTGKLVPVDLNKAFKWYKKAANNGHRYAMFMTGYFLCRGLAEVVNHQEANQWFKKSGKETSCK